MVGVIKRRAGVVANPTPVFTGVDNIDSIDAFPIMVTRNGGAVDVTGYFEAVALAASDTFTSVRMTLPVPSNLANWYDLTGVAGGIYCPAEVYGDEVNNAAIIAWLSPTTAVGIGFSFRYRLLP